jgi:hypothetical protein
MLQNNRAKWGFSCRPGIPATLCNSGCKTACKVTENMDVTTSAAYQQTEVLTSSVTYVNDTALVISYEKGIRQDTMYVLFFKHASSEHWRFYTYTTDTHITVNEAYSEYNELLFLLVSVDKSGLVSMSTVEISTSDHRSTSAANSEQTTGGEMFEFTTKAQSTFELVTNEHTQSNVGSTTVKYTASYSQNNEKNGSGYSMLNIVGATILCGNILLMLIGLLCIFCCQRSKKRSSMSTRSSKSSSSTLSSGVTLWDDSMKSGSYQELSINGSQRSRSLLNRPTGYIRSRSLQDIRQEASSLYESRYHSVVCMSSCNYTKSILSNVP